MSHRTSLGREARAAARTGAGAGERSRGGGLLAALGLAALLAAGCGAAEGQGQGVVQHLDPEARQITLDHGEIPGLMHAMTMTFELAPEVGLDGIDAGVRVAFHVQEEAGVYTVTSLRRIGP